MEDPSHEYVWLDVTSRDEVLPFYKDSIMAKVLRTAEAPTLRRKAVLRRKNMEHLAATIVNGGAAAFSKSAEPAAAPAAPVRKAERKPESQPAGASSNGGSKNQYDRNVYASDGDAAPTPPANSSAKQAQAPPKPAPAAKPAASPAPAPAPAPAAASPDILDFEPTSPSSSSQSAPAKAPISAPVSDMMDFDEGPAPQQVTTPGSRNVPSSEMSFEIDIDSAPQVSRAELQASRKDKINEQVQKSLDEKQEVRFISANVAQGLYFQPLRQIGAYYLRYDRQHYCILLHAALHGDGCTTCIPIVVEILISCAP